MGDRLDLLDLEDVGSRAIGENGTEDCDPYLSVPAAGKHIDQAVRVTDLRWVLGSRPMVGEVAPQPTAGGGFSPPPPR
jgi:hypothetical protein